MTSRKTSRSRKEGIGLISVSKENVSFTSLKSSLLTGLSMRFKDNSKVAYFFGHLVFRLTGL